MSLKPRSIFVLVQLNSISIVCQWRMNPIICYSSMCHNSIHRSIFHDSYRVCFCKVNENKFQWVLGFHQWKKRKWQRKIWLTSVMAVYIWYELQVFPSLHLRILVSNGCWDVPSFHTIQHVDRTLSHRNSVHSEDIVLIRVERFVSIDELDHVWMGTVLSLHQFWFSNEDFAAGNEFCQFWQFGDVMSSPLWLLLDFWSLCALADQSFLVDIRPCPFLRDVAAKNLWKNHK